jgi:hypothetical protein
MKLRQILLILALAIGALIPLAATATTFAVGPFDAVCSTADPSNLPDVCIENNADNPNSTGWQQLNPFSGQGGVLLRAAKLLAFVTGVASVIMILVAAIRYVTANGDSNAISSAKNTIIYAFVGLIVAALSQGIIVFVVNRLQ